MNNALKTYMDTVDVNISKTTSVVLEFLTTKNVEISNQEKRSLINLLETTLKESSVNGWEVLSRVINTPTTTTRKRKK
jgi:hypothetical protein